MVTLLRILSWLRLRPCVFLTLQSNTFLGMSSSIFSTPYNQYRFIGAPNKVAFLKNLMNVIDVLAIAPYWISLFFLDETPSVESVTDTSTLLEEEGEVINEEDSTFGSVSRIMQVLNNTKPHHKQ